MKGTPSSPPRVLIVDDQADILEALRLLLKGEGYEVETASSPGTALRSVEGADFDVLLVDLNYARDTTSGQEGLDLLARIQGLDSTLRVIVMTAWGSIDLAVEAMRRGARDFIQKPWENAKLLATLRTHIELSRALREGRRLEAENRLLRPSAAPQMIAQSPAMQRVVEMTHRAAPSSASVLITGEHGSGKEVVASALHALSGRSSKPLITVNAGSIPDGLFESELFGHVKGAFTDAKADRVGHFELASGGTLFLDEIANIPLGQQAKLLRAIESGEVQRVGSSKTRQVDTRVLVATNASLRDEVAAGRFREDLLFRLNTIEIHVPPLRERHEDILPLALCFLSRFSERYRKPLPALDHATAQALKSYTWPGNVRELSHVIERAVLMTETGSVTVSDLGLAPASSIPGRLEGMPLEEAEKVLIQHALRRCEGNISQAAQQLGLSRSALYRRLERYGIKSSDE